MFTRILKTIGNIMNESLHWNCKCIVGIDEPSRTTDLPEVRLYERKGSQTKCSKNIPLHKQCIPPGDKIFARIGLASLTHRLDFSLICY